MSKFRSRFLTWATATLIFAYLVILAGSVVRATGSGMGCPDWPKCFGHYIPPTQIDQLEFAEGKHFKKGYFIIWERALWKAKKDLTAGPTINMDNWEKYTKHDYARFNVMHTWTEYVNRLCGALLGVVSMLMLLTSFGVRREDKALPWLSALSVFLIGFEGWLGATVVESNLMPVKITTHMIVALIIVGVLLATISRARYGKAKGSLDSAMRAGDRDTKSKQPRGIIALLAAAVAITLIQIFLGTQVREHVDILDKQWNGAARGQWLDQAGAIFRVHAVLAYGVVITNCALVYLLWRSSPVWPALRKTATLLISLLTVEWLTGVTMALFAIPAYIQPVHLLLALIIFGVQFHLWMKIRNPGMEPAARIVN